MTTPALRVVALGGLGEFGANCLVLETPDDLIVVDAGLLFPDDNTLGLEALCPDFGYIADRKEKLRGIFLTHGHEDHVGGLPTLLARVRAPVHGAPFTLEVARRRLAEADLTGRFDLRPMVAGARVAAGDFRISPIAVAHSIPHCLALRIDTPAGTVLHSGDFKIDEDPLDGTKTDLATLAAAGREGVLLLLADSTNADREGKSRPEAATRPALERMFEGATGRVVLATFSSHVARIAAFAAEARRRGRPLALMGRSIQANVDSAQRLGLLSIPSGVLLPPADIDHPVPPTAAVIAAGCQGEPASALVRAARGEHPAFRFSAGDRVAFSSRVIPGREKPVLRTGEALLRLGAELRDGATDGDLHSSGHAAREDLAELLGAVRPRHFVPIHADLRRLIAHAKLAGETGAAGAIHRVENGQPLDFDERGNLLPAAPAVDCGRLALVGEGLAEVSTEILRDRVRLGANGVAFAAVALVRGRPVDAPAVAVRGLAGPADAELAEEARAALAAHFAHLGPKPRKAAEWEEEMTRELKRWFRRAHGRRPVVLARALD